MNHYVKRTERTLWTVGYDDNHERWHPLSDHDSKEEAQAEAVYLNGGPLPDHRKPGRGKECHILKDESNFAIVADGRRILVYGTEAIDYFIDLYDGIGYKVVLV